mgnify:FL=1
MPVRELPPEQQKQFDDLGRTSRDLERQARKLAATDKAQAEGLREQSRAIWKQAVDMRQAHLQSVIPQLTELAMQRERATGEVCTDIKLTIDVNGYNLEVPEGATALSYPGSAVALLGPKHSVIGYGPWAKTAGSIKARYSAGATTRIQGLAIKADGDAKQLDQFVAAMNSPSLAALVKN